MKCFWCKRGLNFEECEVDHVIPQSTSKIVLKSMVKDYQLGTDFSIDDYGNWVPSCNACVKLRAKGAYRQSSALPSWFEIVRSKMRIVEAKVHQIEGEQSLESALRTLVEMAERAEITHDAVERIAGPFFKSVEGGSRGTVEFRFNQSVRLLVAPDGVRLVPQSEIRYEKLVDTIVESGDWKKRRSIEEIKEGPGFGEGRSRKPGTGA